MGSIRIPRSKYYPSTDYVRTESGNLLKFFWVDRSLQTLLSNAGVFNE